MINRRNNREDFSEESTESRYTEILDHFTNLCLNRFTWNNLPTGLTSERLEEMLINYGQCFCFKRSNGGITILGCTGNDELNIYGDFNRYNVMGYNGYSKFINADKGVRIKNNLTCSSDMGNIEIYAKRIDDIERTQEVNLFQQNIPKIILSEQGSELTAKNIIKKLKSYKVAIFAKKALPSSISSSDVLDNNTPLILNDLQDYKKSLENELLSKLGINNNNTDKKERLIVDEVNSNNDEISINLDLAYDMRKRACEEINKMFSLNISVSKREVEENGTIHTDN